MVSDDAVGCDPWWPPKPDPRWSTKVPAGWEDYAWGWEHLSDPVDEWPWLRPWEMFQTLRARAHWRGNALWLTSDDILINTTRAGSVLSSSSELTSPQS